jgi:7tm Chemosensory receptor
MSKIRIEIFYCTFGFKFDPQKFTPLEILLWCCNVLATVLNYTISIWYIKKKIFAKASIATYVIDMVMWSGPQVTHMLLLLEVVRKRKLIRKFWELIRFESVELQGYSHILTQSETKHRTVVLEVFIVCILLGAVVDLVSLYLFFDSQIDFYFFYWLTILWSLNGVRIGLSLLFVALEQMKSRLDTIIDLLETMVLQTRWKIVNETGIQRQFQKIHILYVHAWSINDCINRIFGWIMLAYTFNVFSFLTSNMFWAFKLVWYFKNVRKESEYRLNEKAGQKLMMYFFFQKVVLFNFLMLLTTFMGFLKLITIYESILDKVSMATEF